MCARRIFQTLVATGISLVVLAGCGEEASDAAKKARDAAGKAAREAADAGKAARDRAKDTSKRLTEKGRELKDKAAHKADEVGRTAAQKAEEVGQAAAETLLAAKIRMAFRGRDLLENVNIEIACQGDVVTLSGKVAQRRQMSLAVRLAKEVKGVARVKSHIEVAASSEE